MSDIVGSGLIYQANPAALSTDEYERQRRSEGGVEVTLSTDYHFHPILMEDLGHMHHRGDEFHWHAPEIGWGKARFPSRVSDGPGTG